jgi:hypothetical protein
MCPDFQFEAHDILFDGVSRHGCPELHMLACQRQLDTVVYAHCNAGAVEHKVRYVYIGIKAGHADFVARAVTGNQSPRRQSPSRRALDLRGAASSDQSPACVYGQCCTQQQATAQPGQPLAPHQYLHAESVTHG